MVDGNWEKTGNVDVHVETSKYTQSENKARALGNTKKGPTRRQPATVSFLHSALHTATTTVFL